MFGRFWKETFKYLQIGEKFDHHSLHIIVLSMYVKTFLPYFKGSLEIKHFLNIYKEYTYT